MKTQVYINGVFKRKMQHKINYYRKTLKPKQVKENKNIKFQGKK